MYAIVLYLAICAALYFPYVRTLKVFVIFGVIQHKGITMPPPVFLLPPLLLPLLLFWLWRGAFENNIPFKYIWELLSARKLKDKIWLSPVNHVLVGKLLFTGDNFTRVIPGVSKEFFSQIDVWYNTYEVTHEMFPIARNLISICDR